MSLYHLFYSTVTAVTRTDIILELRACSKQSHKSISVHQSWEIFFPALFPEVALMSDPSFKLFIQSSQGMLCLTVTTTVWKEAPLNGISTHPLHTMPTCMALTPFPNPQALWGWSTSPLRGGGSGQLLHCHCTFVPKLAEPIPCCTCYCFSFVF